MEVDVDAKLDRVRERLNANKKMLYDLSEPTAALSSEFYSHEELASFNKPTDKKVFLSFLLIFVIFIIISSCYS